MLAYIITMRSGHRYTVRAEELRQNSDNFFEFVASPPATADVPEPAKQVIAVFDRNDVFSVVAREFLIAAEEPNEGARPHMIAKTDPIPF